MLLSMTGYAARSAKVAALGQVSIELRSSNHKFLETVLHLPEGFLSLEDKIKKEIETKIKRGRVVCSVNISAASSSAQVLVNQRLLKHYILALQKIKSQLETSEEISLDTLIRLPGVLSLSENAIPAEKVWPQLKTLVSQTVQGLLKLRRAEGRALSALLRKQALSLQSDLEILKERFKKVVKDKVARLESDDERVSFLKNSDITEEVERLAFHIHNFLGKLTQSVPIGKELDFIAQEMQREANTTGAKSCDGMISARVVEIKSKIEKIREQAQNIE